MSAHLYGLRVRGEFIRSYFVDKETKMPFEEWHRFHEFVSAQLSGTEILARTADEPIVIARYSTPEEAEAAFPVALDILSGKQAGEVEAAPTAPLEVPPIPVPDTATVKKKEQANVSARAGTGDAFDENGLIDPFKAFDLRKVADEIKNDFDVATAPIPSGAKKWLNKR